MLLIEQVVEKILLLAGSFVCKQGNRVTDEYWLTNVAKVYDIIEQPCISNK